jgi:hypothetical protein
MRTLYPANVALFWAITLLQFLSSPTVGAQPAREGATAIALGGATPALGGDLWGIANPASWAAIPSSTVGFFAAEGFGLPELRESAARVAAPLGRTVVAAGATSFGDTAYRESSWLAGVARPLFPGTHRPIDMGVRIVLHRVKIDGYGSATAVGLSAGWQVNVAPSLRLGASAENVNGPNWAEDEPLPRRLALGMVYQPTSESTFLFALRRSGHASTSFHAGLEWRPIRVLALRAGATGEPWRLSTGVAVHTAWIRAEATAERHYALGWTPAVAVYVHGRGAL